MKECITFFGGDARVGTTMIAQSVAEELTLRKKKTLMIFASSECFDDYMPTADGNAAGLDSLREKTAIGRNDVRAVIGTNNGTDYIRGISMMYKLRYFDVNLIGKIVRLIDDEYDYIITDGGHNYQYPLSVSSLLAASRRYYVLTPGSRCISRFGYMYGTLLKSPQITVKPGDEIIVNMLRKKENASLEYIKSRFGMNVSTVAYYEAAEACEATRQTLMRINRAYHTQISEIAEQILNR